MLEKSGLKKQDVQYVGSRTFRIDVDGDGELDSVHFDKSTSMAWICFGDEVASCKSMAVSGKDLIPVEHDFHGRPGLGDIGDINGSKVCRLDARRETLECQESNIAKLRDPVHALNSDSNRLHCAETSDPGGIKCTAAMRAIADTKLVFGRFSGGNELEVIDLKPGQSRICTLSEMPTCTVLRGLGVSGNATAAAARFLPNRRHYLVLSSASQISVCALERGADAPTFNCQVRAIEGLTSIQVYVVPSIRGGESGETVQHIFIPPSAAKRQPMNETLNGVEIFTARFANEAVREMVDQHLASEPRAKLFEDNQWNWDTAIYAPTWFTADWSCEGDCPSTFTYQGWSDVFGYYLWDWSASRPRDRSECLNGCDIMRNLDQQNCNQHEALLWTLGIGGTGVGMVIGAMAGGPAGAWIGFQIGVGITGILPNAYGATCRSNADWRAASCRASC